VFDRVRADHHIQITAQQCRLRGKGKGGGQVQFDLRPLFAKPVQRRHQPLETGMAFNRQMQSAGLAGGQRTDIAQALTHQRQHLIRQHQQALTGHSKAHRPGTPVQQTDAEAVLQITQLMRQRRLGDMQSLGRLDQRAGLANSIKGFQMAQTYHEFFSS